MSRPKSITLSTRRKAIDSDDAVDRVIDIATRAGVQVRLPQDEVDKHSIREREGVVLGADPDADTDLSVVLGGDGTILSSLRRYAGKGVPTFAFNYGAIGFLSTVEGGELEQGLQRALSGDFDTLSLPILSTETESGRQLAVNDLSFHRRQDLRVAELGYSVVGKGLGEVRADGLVVATPAGSTGYNLANGGPVMAWGVEGYVVSFIAPHTLTARALVVAPDDMLEVTNRSADEPVDLTTDGRRVCALAPKERVEIRFERDQALLAQLPGSSFYGRLRDKFGLLSS